MPRGVTTPGLEPGAQMEIRVAQAWFWDGYYVRRGVDLQHRFGADVSAVTDLDILANSFDSSLVNHTYIGEVKSGRSSGTPRPLDRAVWARGLRELVGAEAAEVTTAFGASLAVKEFANRIGVTIQHVDDLSRREARLEIPDVQDSGAQGESIALQLIDIARDVKNEPDLERAYWFLRSEVWFLDVFDALKRTLGLMQQLKTQLPGDADNLRVRTVRWMYAESISVATLQLVRAAGLSNRMDSKSFVDFAIDQLSSGDIPFHSMRHLASRIDEYIGKLLATTNMPAEAKIEAMGAFEPTPPSYAEPLLELIVRLAVHAPSAARLPRQVDLVIFERLVRRRNVASNLQKKLALDAEFERLLRYIGVFLRAQIQLPDVVDRALAAPLQNEGHGNFEQASLFGTEGAS